MSSEDLHIDCVSADDESSERNSIYFSTIRSRHAENFFTGLLHGQNREKIKKNFIRYPSYDNVNPNKNGDYPHLLLNKLSFARDLRTSSDKALLRLPVLKQEFHNISFDLESGDILALQYTKENDMNCLLKVISGVRDIRGKLSGEIFINGHKMGRERLEKTIGYLSKENPTSSLTIRQYLQINAMFSPPMNEKYGGIGNFINKLMADLGLTSMCDIVCSRLNKSQWQRVKLAVQLIRDPTILVCNDILKELDVHDQCFIIDYLRDWAVKTNRIVIMAIVPTSLDVLRMFSKTLILASGRIVYCGHPSTMQQYFESIGCPCPSYKNACDYYVDLVTHDNLTTEASRESSVRIVRMVSKWQQMAPALNRGSSGKVLLDLRTGHFLMRIFAMLLISWFDFCNNKYSRISNISFIFIISTCLSLWLSDLPTLLSDAFLNRQAFLDIFMFYFPFLVVFINLKTARHRLKEFHKILVVRKCSSILVSFAFMICMLPTMLIDSMAFVFPAVAFIDFHRKNDDFFNALLNFYCIIFLNMVSSQVLCSLFSNIGNDFYSHFGFVFTYTLLYIFNESLIRNPVVFFNPLSFPTFELSKFIYDENYELFSRSINMSSPLKMFSCANSISNTTSISKGLCHRVSTADLVSYYSYHETFRKQSISHFLFNYVNYNYIFIFVIIIFVMLLLSTLLFYSNRSGFYRPLR